MRTNFPFNVLTAAQTAIRTQELTLRRFQGRTRNSAGIYTSGYEPDVTVEGSMQPISRALYQKMGLNFEKDYFTLLTTDPVLDLGRARSGDQVIFDGGLYEAVGETNWRRSGGWNRIVFVFIERVTP